MIEDRDEKIEGLKGRIKKLLKIINDTQSFAEQYPDIALNQSRKSAEIILRNIFSVEIGEPGKINYDVMVRKLIESKVFPHRITLHLKTIQAYGNHGSHGNDDENEELTHAEIQPCLSALALLTNWYFNEYLGIESTEKTTDIVKTTESSGNILQTIKDIDTFLNEALEESKNTGDIAGIDLFAEEGITIESNEYEKIAEVCFHIEKSFMESDWNAEIVSNMKSVFHELANNSLEYGCNNSGMSMIAFFKLQNTYAKFTIKDTGPGFDHETWMKNLDEKVRGNVVSERGRGIFLSQKLANNIRYEDGGRTVVAVFYKAPSRYNVEQQPTGDTTTGISPIKKSSMDIGPRIERISISGPLTIMSDICGSLDSVLYDLDRNGVHAFVLDFSRCTVIDSIGIGYITKTHGMYRDRIALINLTERNHSLLSRLGLDKILKIAPSFEDAKKYFMEPM